MTFLDLFVVATGTTISAGFFLLPGLAAQNAGPAVIAAYFLAGLLVIPALLSKAELSTALPRAGGTYHFLDRSLGPIAGTIGGFGAWFALMLKSGFALIGFAAYFLLLIHNLGYHLPMKLIVVILCVVLMILNIFGSRTSFRIQILVVAGVLGVMVFFIGKGVPSIHPSAFIPVLPHGWPVFFSTIGLVFISYSGLTRIASMAVDTQDPERRIPQAMFAALGTVLLLYTLGVTVMVGVLRPEQLIGTLTPASDAARVFSGQIGYYVVAAAALLACLACANATLFSASRYPFAMSRDRILPHSLHRIGRFHTPSHAILVTGLIIIVFVTIFDVVEVAKLAGAFQLMLYAAVNFAVIVMRESGIEDYSPDFRCPLYPWVQIAGIFSTIAIILLMGTLEILVSMGIIAAGSLWYLLYAVHRVHRVGAWTRILDRMSEREETHLHLIRELREIQKERGLKEGDPFEAMVIEAPVIEVAPGETFVEFFRKVGFHFEETLGLDSQTICEEFLLRNKIGETPAERGVAIPHMRLEALNDFHLVLGRSREGLTLPETEEPIHVIYVLLGAQEHASVHIRILAELASRSDRDGFVEDWLKAKGPEDVKTLLLEFPKKEKTSR